MRDRRTEQQYRRSTAGDNRLQITYVYGQHCLSRFDGTVDHSYTKYSKWNVRRPLDHNGDCRSDWSHAINDGQQCKWLVNLQWRRLVCTDNERAEMWLYGESPRYHPVRSVPIVCVCVCVCACCSTLMSTLSNFAFRLSVSLSSWWSGIGSGRMYPFIEVELIHLAHHEGNPVKRPARFISACAQYAALPLVRCCQFTFPGG